MLEAPLGLVVSRGRFLYGVTGLLFATFLLINLVVIGFVDAYAWDDGAITLTYARTLAEHGVFALISSSETVRGTSSLLLAGLMALLHRALDPSVDMRGSGRPLLIHLLATRAFLYLNGHALEPRQDDEVATLVAVADGSLGEEALELWLAQNSSTVD